MGESAGGLSDVLRRMAEGRRHPGADADAADRHEATPPPLARRRERAEPEDRVDLDKPAVRTSASPARRPAPPNQDGLKAAAVPVFLATAALLLVPALWAVLVLAGVDVWRSDSPDARRMALAMLTCAPLAAALIAGAWFFRRQLQRPSR